MAELGGGSGNKFQTQGSTVTVRAQSTRNLRDLIAGPDVDSLTRTLSGGYKNPRRQASTHVRFKKMFSYSTDKEEFTKAAKDYFSQKRED